MHENLIKHKDSDGTYTGSEDLKTFTELVGYKNTFNICSISRWKYLKNKCYSKYECKNVGISNKKKSGYMASKIRKT